MARLGIVWDTRCGSRNRQQVRQDSYSEAKRLRSFAAVCSAKEHAAVSLEPCLSGRGAGAL